MSRRGVKEGEWSEPPTHLWVADWYKRERGGGHAGHDDMVSLTRLSSSHAAAFNKKKGLNAIWWRGNVSWGIGVRRDGTQRFILCLVEEKVSEESEVGRGPKKKTGRGWEKEESSVREATWVALWWGADVQRGGRWESKMMRTFLRRG